MWGGLTREHRYRYLEIPDSSDHLRGHNTSNLRYDQTVTVHETRIGSHHAFTPALRYIFPMRTPPCCGSAHFQEI